MANSRGLRAHLAALVLAVLLPSLALGAAIAWRMAGNYRAAFAERLSDTAQALALALDREVQAPRGRLEVGRRRTGDGALGQLAVAPRPRPGPPGGIGGSASDDRRGPHAGRRGRQVTSGRRRSPPGAESAWASPRPTPRPSARWRRRCPATTGHGAAQHKPTQVAAAVAFRVRPLFGHRHGRSAQEPTTLDTCWMKCA
jgi:hypothetical protein